MVTHVERLSRVEQAITVQGDALHTCQRCGKEVAGIAVARGYHPLFGGDEAVHTLGKIAEMGFMLDALEHNAIPTVTPFPRPGEAYHLDYDFAYGDTHVDVKGGWVYNRYDARGMPYKSFGMMVPTEKAKSDRSEYYVYCLCWLDTGYHVAPIGFATSDQVKAGAIRNNVRHTCYVVPMCDLHPMNEFYDLIAGVVPAHEQSVKAILEV